MSKLFIKNFENLNHLKIEKLRKKHNLHKKKQKGCYKIRFLGSGDWRQASYAASQTGLQTFLFENGHERDFFVVIYKQKE